MFPFHLSSAPPEDQRQRSIDSISAFDSETNECETILVPRFPLLAFLGDWLTQAIVMEK